MSSTKARESIKLVLIVLWLVFTVSFAIWWLRFSLDHISELAGLQPERAEHWARQKRMVFWEGTSWLVLLALGGGALIALVQKERLRAQRIREFFASFSHEIKTSLASLRVQAETLQDELGANSSPVLNRLVDDTVRLHLQLENSLFLASQEDLKLYVQPLKVRELLERIAEQWPGLKFDIEGASGPVRGDERALRTIFSNLVQNARVHGKATSIRISLDGHKVVIEDNGKGFDGDATSLGQLFHRPRTSSGSGLGLYICLLLAQKMGGTIAFASSGGKGFRAQLTLPGGDA